MSRIEPPITPFGGHHQRTVFDACLVAARPVGIGKAVKIVDAYKALSETPCNAPHIEQNFTPN
jgi:hypothetical protein